jgi:hypothetical protein
MQVGVWYCPAVQREAGGSYDKALSTLQQRTFRVFLKVSRMLMYADVC